ncbi:hypothetical protein TVAG_507990 [Trichomonas vaginalis G3]|uniref:Uncharacterized protein n=1 Tax=Trichomonas vaginalis (strain ATCC PRA-98 / G3) TaxID=412133 RepID=A2GB37_TRIV3|nr:hypothetical protein TVAGG3_0788200 [Trichomonas vaginalis G3]EAX85629.1 hypothetical protein TVAG_507990 [Trichomonas vaginalis G3]KAI5495558.1 hypothetical protein TVAGG3_0788200 [Trichomonas vaginalis G3]|eukprot:XP_001298559.1 hypothetical protein [Trichomonas vaginalis G3]
MGPFGSDSSSTKSNSNDTSECDFTESEVTSPISPQKEEKKEEQMVSNMDFVTKTIESTKMEYKNFYFLIVLVFLVPWLVKLFMAVYLGYALTYEKMNEKYVLENISSLYSQLQHIPNIIFNKFDTKYNKNLEKLYNAKFKFIQKPDKNLTEKHQKSDKTRKEKFINNVEQNNTDLDKEEFDENSKILKGKSDKKLTKKHQKSDKNEKEKFVRKFEQNDLNLDKEEIEENSKNIKEKSDKNNESNNDKNLVKNSFEKDDLKNNENRKSDKNEDIFIENVKKSDKSENSKNDGNQKGENQKISRDDFIPTLRTEFYNINFTLGEREIEKYIHKLSLYYKEILPLSDNFDIIDLNIQTGMKSFIFILIFFYIIFAFGVYKMEYFYRIGYESLFHFPLRYLEDLLKERDEPPPQKFPTNCVLELVIGTATNLINNVSPNLYNLTGCYPLDVIGRKYDEIFPIIENRKRENSEENRTFHMNFRKSKNFIEERNVVGRITRVILYDKYDDKNDIVNLLSQHIPHEIAKIYCEEGNISCCESQGYFMVCKYNNTEYNSSIEQVFKSIHNIMQCYSTVHLIGIEGSILRFVFRGSDRSVPLFFIRDLLNISVCNHHLDNFVVFCGSISSEIVIRDEEPYVFSFVSSQSKSESASFYVCNRSILFVDDCLHLCEEFSGEIIEGNHSLRGFQIKFEDLENVVCNIY